ncbi:MAG: hypothetical protein JNM69_00330 [Archangium sp.]|nr:hypothetical protein [Archangium sp.]
MNGFLVRYLISWLAFCGLAVVLFVKDVRVGWRAQAQALLVPWRLALFVPAIVFVTFAGRYTDDETWDVGCGGGMALLTFLTSGFSIGTLARALRGRASFSEVVVALAVALFSSAWFYDGYLLLRDGAYTPRWLGNLRLSPIIYACAGLVLNLEARRGRLAFAFTRDDWPAPLDTSPSWRLALASLPLVLVAAYVLVAFVGWRSPL